MSVRTDQFKAAWALGLLLMQDLPEVTWHLSPHSSGLLEGQVSALISDDEARKTVATWAEFLGSEIHERRAFNETFTEVKTIAHFGDNETVVKIWGLVEKSKDYDRET